MGLLERYFRRQHRHRERHMRWHTQVNINNRDFCLLAAVCNLGAETHSALSILRTIGWDKHMMNHRRSSFLCCAWFLISFSLSHMIHQCPVKSAILQRKTSRYEVLC